MPDAKNEESSDRKPQVVHTIRSIYPTETYVFVQFLKANPICRIIFIIFSIGVVGFSVSKMYFGFFTEVKSDIEFLLLLFVVPWLFYVAAISSRRVEVVFPQRQAAEETKKAEKSFEEKRTVEAALKLDFTRLNEYYQINQNQARSSFRYAVLAMMVGLATIIYGIWLFYHSDHTAEFMAAMSVASGIVINVVSAFFIHLHSTTQTRALRYFDRLSRLQNISIAIQLVDAYKDVPAQINARDLIMRELLNWDVSPTLEK